MPTSKSPLERSAGKLISAIQKEWNEEFGSAAEFSLDVMDRGHELLMAAKCGEVGCVLKGLSVTQYLGELWIRKHPNVLAYIDNFEKELEASSNV